jgi:HlyD family secretion protein
MKRKTRQVAIWSTTALVLALITWGLLPKPVAVDLSDIGKAKLSVTVVEEGKTRVIDRFVVSAPVAGYARRVELEVGDAVSSGQTLLHLDPMRSPNLDPRRQAEARAAVSAAEAALAAAQEGATAASAEADLASNEYERVRRVAQQGLLSQGTLDAAYAAYRTAAARKRSAEFTVEVAKGELQAARATLDYTAAGTGTDQDHVSVAVTSPVDGRILSVIHESEGAVPEGQPMVEVGDPRALEVEVEVLSLHAVKLHPGTPVRFLRWGGDYALEGVVKVVEPTGFTKVSSLGVEEQRVRVICDISSDYELWKNLGDGYRVEAEFILWEEDDVLQVPASALFRSGADWAVFRLENGRAVVTTVELGARNGLAAQVLNGLDPGDQVIIYPGDDISNGFRVRGR